MNPTLELNFWLRLTGILALESGLIVALAFTAQIVVRSAFWRRAVWQIAFVCLLFVAGAELTGIGRGVSVWLAGKPAPERIVSVRIVPTEERLLLPPPMMEQEISEPIFVPEKEMPLARSVWWPGMLWLAGLGLIVVRILGARIVLTLLRLQKPKISDAALLNRVAGLARRLGFRRRMHLLETSGLSSPMTFGVLWPSIGLPSGFAQKFTSVQQDAILAHELAHLAARDPFWYLLADCATALLWWQPLIWWARHRLHSASEHAADEAAALLENGPSTLAECLVHLGQQMTRARSFGWLGMDGSGFRSHLGQRVERLLNLKKTKQPVRGWKIFVAKTSVTILLAAVVILTSGWIQNKDAPRPKDWKSALQQSWNGSFASLAMIALAENKTDSVLQSTPPKPLAYLSGKTPAKAGVKKVTDKSEPIAKKQILVTAKIFSIGRDTSKTLIERRFGIPKNPATVGIITEERGNRVSQFLDRRVDVKILGTHRILNSEGQSSELFIGEGFTNSRLVSRRISLSVLPQTRGGFDELDLGIRIGDISEKGQMSGKMDLDFKTSVVVPIQQSAIFLASQKQDGGTNYLIIVTPSRPTVADLKNLENITDLIRRKVSKAGFFEQEGKLLFEMGKPDEAEEKFDQALKLEPQNAAALYYKNLIREARYKKVSKNREQEAKDALAAVQKQWDPAANGNALPIPNPATRTNLIYTTKGRQTIKQKLERIRLPEVGFENLPLGEVLKFLRDESKKRDPERKGINFFFNPQSSAPNPPPQATFLDPTATIFTPASVATVDLNKVIINITPALPDVRLVDVLDAIVQVADQPIDYKIEDYAIVFGPKAVGAVTYYTRQYKVNPKTFVESLKRALPSSANRIEVGGSGQDDPVHGAFTYPDPQFNTRQGLGLGIVTRTNQMQRVNQLIREYFTAAGVDFGPSGSGPNGKALFFNDRTGLLMVRASLEDLEIISTAIEALNPEPLVPKEEEKALPKKEASIEEVVDPNKLFTRTYKVNSTNFVQGLERAMPHWAEHYEVYFHDFTGVNYTNRLEGPLKTQLPLPKSLIVREYFSAAGVDFGLLGAPFDGSEGGNKIVPNGKTFYFSQGAGLLMVRATLKDLEIVSKAVKALDIAPLAGPEGQKALPKMEVSAEKEKVASSSSEPAQISIESKFVEIGELPGKKNDWNWLVAGSSSQLATNESIELKPIHGFTNFSDAFPPGTLSNSIPRFVTTVLTESRAKEVLRQIDGQRGADVLSAPRVTTLSEHAAQVSIEDEVNIRLNPKVPAVTTIRTGPALDLLPKELADGLTVHLTVNAMIKEVVKKHSGILRKESYSPKVRQMAAEANLYDGQTLVLGELAGGKEAKKRLLVFVTAKLIDSRGNRIHSEKDLSFTTNSIPKQPVQE